jgi:hypothetical protein
MLHFCNPFPEWLGQTFIDGNGEHRFITDYLFSERFFNSQSMTLSGSGSSAAFPGGASRVALASCPAAVPVPAACRLFALTA